MPFQRISEMERGLTNPTFETLSRLADGLGVKLSYLFGRAETIRNGNDA